MVLTPSALDTMDDTNDTITASVVRIAAPRR